jgi:hypothetical protein
MNIFVKKLPERPIHGTRTALALDKPMYLWLQQVCLCVHCKFEWDFLLHIYEGCDNLI